jgi:hypothetical protein
MCKRNKLVGYDHEITDCNNCGRRFKTRAGGLHHRCKDHPGMDKSLSYPGCDYDKE